MYIKLFQKTWQEFAKAATCLAYLQTKPFVPPPRPKKFVLVRNQDGEIYWPRMYYVVNLPNAETICLEELEQQGYQLMSRPIDDLTNTLFFSVDILDADTILRALAPIVPISMHRVADYSMMQSDQWKDGMRVKAWSDMEIYELCAGIPSRIVSTIQTLRRAKAWAEARIAGQQRAAEEILRQQEMALQTLRKEAQ